MRSVKFKKLIIFFFKWHTSKKESLDYLSTIYHSVMTRMRRRQRETKTKRLITNQGGQWRSHRLELFFWDRNRPAFFWFVGKYKAGELGLIWNRCFVLAELFWTATCRDNFERRVCFACEINLCWNVSFVLFLESWLCMICCRERSFDHLRI